MPVNTGQIQAKGQFPKGKSGNPRGKPKGARHRSSLIAEQLFADEIQDICKTVIEEAKAGDMQAAKIVLDRILPPKKDRPINIALPEMHSSAELSKAMSCVVNAVGSGQISPLEGEAIARIIDVHTKTLELTEFEQRLSALEKKA